MDRSMDNSFRPTTNEKFCIKCKDPFTLSDEIVVAEGFHWHQQCFVTNQKDDASFMDNEHACVKCHESIKNADQLVNYQGRIWHMNCFVCAHCFRPLESAKFYDFEGRKYCENDFLVLFAPICYICKDFIRGRLVKALGKTWHPDCLNCENCSNSLADTFKWFNGKALCNACLLKEKSHLLGKFICTKCNSIIDEGHIKYKGESYHCYHFNCYNCNEELTDNAREKDSELYCLRCFDKMGVSICAACRRPIEDRIVNAMGKCWHFEHFACAKCEKPFKGERHFEKKGLAYCELHYHQLFGNICFYCNNIINANEVFTALNKNYCLQHFSCSICEKQMNLKSKFYEFDMKPVCKNCFTSLPSELKKRLRNAYEAN